MTAPVLSLDHARSFEVPCTWNGHAARLWVNPLLGDLTRWAPTLFVGGPYSERWLGRGEWCLRDEFEFPHDVAVDTFPSAQAAVDAAFTTDQIGEAT